MRLKYEWQSIVRAINGSAWSKSRSQRQPSFIITSLRFMCAGFRYCGISKHSSQISKSANFSNSILGMSASEWPAGTLLTV